MDAPGPAPRAFTARFGESESTAHPGGSGGPFGFPFPPARTHACVRTPLLFPRLHDVDRARWGGDLRVRNGRQVHPPVRPPVPHSCLSAPSGDRQQENENILSFHACRRVHVCIVSRSRRAHCGSHNVSRAAFPAAAPSPTRPAAGGGREAAARPTPTFHARERVHIIHTPLHAQRGREGGRVAGLPAPSSTAAGTTTTWRYRVCFGPVLVVYGLVHRIRGGDAHSGYRLARGTAEARHIDRRGRGESESA